MKLIEENMLKKFLFSCDEKGIQYVSWKNNHELNLSLAGHGDLDLYVPFSQKSQFLILCRENGWLQFLNPVATYPNILHFYNLDYKLEVFHLHVYFELITGDTWIKEYSLPIDKWLLENRVKSEEYGIWVLNDRSQAFIFLIRHLLKCGSLTGRYLYWRDIDSYAEEWKKLNKDLTHDELLGPFDLSNHLNGIGVSKAKLKLPRISNSLRFRYSCSLYLRYSYISLPILRFLTLWKRLINKVFYKRKKVFPSKGFVLAISGVDGSGKSSMLEEIYLVFGKFLTIHKYHMGKPQGKFIDTLWRVIGNESKSPSIASTSNNNLPTPRRKAIIGVILALMRLRKARAIFKLANKGGLMIIDRWPTNELGKMDGPRVIIAKDSGWFENFCKKIETWAYSVMPKADLCYLFEVPIEIAISRNRLRVKENKETEEMISARYFNNLEYKPISKKTIKFDNSGDFETNRKEFLSSVWHQISLMC